MRWPSFTTFGIGTNPIGRCVAAKRSYKQDGDRTNGWIGRSGDLRRMLSVIGELLCRKRVKALVVQVPYGPCVNDY